MTSTTTASHPLAQNEYVRSPRSLVSLLVLAVLALLGVASLLTSDLGLGPIAEQAGIAEDQLRLIVLIQPALLTLIAVFIGWRTSLRTGFRTPILDRGIAGLSRSALVASLLVAVAAGAVLAMYGWLTTEVVVLNVGEGVGLSLLSRILYGGITEEVLLRWGMMGLLAWLLLRFVPGASSTRSRWIWTANVIAAVLFAVGHFPALALISGATAVHYVLSFVANTVLGVAYGWTFSRFGLEYALVAHAGTHVVGLGVLGLLF